MSKYLNQAPKDFDSQSVRFKLAQGTLSNLTGPRWGIQPKFDGCMMIVTVDQAGVASATSREGTVVRSLDHILRDCEESFPPGTVLFGEAYQFDVAFPRISGNFRRHTPSPNMVFVVFDITTVEEYEAGGDEAPYSARYQMLGEYLPRKNLLRAPMHMMDSTINALDFAIALKASGGYDGAILRDLTAPWAPGAVKNGAVIKVKPVQSYDLKVTGWFPGKGKHLGKAGGITVEYKGVVSSVGTGFSDAERVQISLDGPDSPIAEIECMGLTETGALREPRYKGWRHDKTQPD